MHHFDEFHLPRDDLVYAFVAGGTAHAARHVPLRIEIDEEGPLPREGEIGPYVYGARGFAHTAFLVHENDDWTCPSR